MKPLNAIYPPRFFARRHKMAWRAPILCGAIQDVLYPKSVVDVGCAIGDLVAEWIRMGVDSKGIEGSEACLPYIVSPSGSVVINDLRRPFLLEKEYDLATCFEVAEHIEPEYAAVFVYNLVNMSDRILVSIAPPGQGGHYHVNCQPEPYWNELFSRFGYIPDASVAENVRQRILPWAKKPGVLAIYQNLAFYRRSA